MAYTFEEVRLRVNRLAEIRRVREYPQITVLDFQWARKLGIKSRDARDVLAQLAGNGAAAVVCDFTKGYTAAEVLRCIADSLSDHLIDFGFVCRYATAFARDQVEIGDWNLPMGHKRSIVRGLDRAIEECAAYQSSRPDSICADIRERCQGDLRSIYL